MVFKNENTHTCTYMFQTTCSKHWLLTQQPSQHFFKYWRGPYFIPEAVPLPYDSKMNLDWPKPIMVVQFLSPVIISNMACDLVLANKLRANTYWGVLGSVSFTLRGKKSLRKRSSHLLFEVFIPACNTWSHSSNLVTMSTVS